ncbi:MAG: hypothetical protein ACRDKG_08810, partial [Actinomycetota bacterium]
GEGTRQAGGGPHAEDGERREPANDNRPQDGRPPHDRTVGYATTDGDALVAGPGRRARKSTLLHGSLP